MKYNKRNYKSAKELRRKKLNNNIYKKNITNEKYLDKNNKVNKLRELKKNKNNNKNNNKSNNKSNNKRNNKSNNKSNKIMKGGNEYNIDTCLNEIKNFAISNEYQGPFTNEKCFTGGSKDGAPCRNILGGPRLNSVNSLNHKARTPSSVKINGD